MKMRFISKKIEGWKEDQDFKKAALIYRTLKSFWSSNRRKDLIVEILLTNNFSNDDLVDLGNLLGYTSHMRERNGIDYGKDTK